MDFSRETITEPLPFGSSSSDASNGLNIEVDDLVSQAFANAESAGFDFDDFLEEVPENQVESSWLYPKDPAAFDGQQQLDYKQVISDDFTAKSTLSFDSNANASHKRAVPSSSTLAQPMVSSYGPTSSDAMAGPPISQVESASFFLSSLPTAEYGLEFSNPELGGFYPKEEEPENLCEWLNQQNFEKEQLEQRGLEQARPDYVSLEALIQQAEAEQALEEINRCEVQRLDEIPPVQAAPPQVLVLEMGLPNQPLDEKTANRRRNAKNKRSANIAAFDPKKHYQPLPQPPQNWGSIDQNGQPTFRYTKDGELEPAFTFAKDQMKEYLTTHPLGDRRILWVQVAPADSANRYPGYPGDNSSAKCRFHTCPIKTRTIEKGEYRVAFDELSWMGLNLDPFHNAGTLNVQADTRQFPHEKKKMAITRDHPEMAKIVNNFIKNSKSWEGPFEYPKTLCYALTVEQLKREPRKRQAERDRRDGNSIDKHMNDLDFLANNAKRKKEGLPWKIYKSPAEERPQSRKRKSTDEEGHASSPEKPTKKPKISQRPSRQSTAFSPRRKPQVTKRPFRQLDDKASKGNPRMKMPHVTKRKSSDDMYDASADGSAGRRNKKTKTMTQFCEDEYDADESNLSGSSPHIKGPSGQKRKACPVEEVSRPAKPVQKRKTPKRKAREFDEEERDPNEVFQEAILDSMKMYGLNKRLKKGDKAGLKTPLGDMSHLPY